MGLVPQNGGFSPLNDTTGGVAQWLGRWSLTGELS